MDVKRATTIERSFYLFFWIGVYLFPCIIEFIETPSLFLIYFPWQPVLCSWQSFTPYLVLFLFFNLTLNEFLLKQRWRLFLLSLLILICGFYLWDLSIIRQNCCSATNIYFPPFYHFILVFLLLGGNTIVKLYIHNTIKQYRITKLELEKKEYQLAYLRNQVKPHFLMNTLNNIHTLIDISPTEAQEALIELSKLMRYVLYDSSHLKVCLTQELAYIKNYIHLMSLRYGKELTLKINFPQVEQQQILIPPLLFVNYIENAFKHGVNPPHPSYIYITIQITSEKLCFTCQNSYFPKPLPTSKIKKGIGLTNNLKRLSLLYGTKFTQEIKTTPEQYTLTLNIPLK